jgi:hypothetical protein
MRVGGILWGRRPPSAGGGPVLGRPRGLAAAQKETYIRKFRNLFIINGIRWEARALVIRFGPSQGPAIHRDIP